LLGYGFLKESVGSKKEGFEKKKSGPINSSELKLNEKY
jgi:hypothetical protein